ncbi:MAG: hypothetical protein ACRDF4_03795, partial [Rhabdochlamydiaceae bacterium]
MAIAEGLRNFFVVPGKNLRLRTLPMGFRPSCEVSQGITWALLSFELPEGVVAFSCIDNVLFVGSPDGVKTAAHIFVTRCNKIGAVLNEDKPPVL